MRYTGGAASDRSAIAPEMSIGHVRLVQRMQYLFDHPETEGEDVAWLPSAVSELYNRVGHLHKLDSAFSDVRLSEHIDSLLAVSVPVRSGGVSLARSS